MKKKSYYDLNSFKYHMKNFKKRKVFFFNLSLYFYIPFSFWFGVIFLYWNNEIEPTIKFIKKKNLNINHLTIEEIESKEQVGIIKKIV